MSEKDVTHISCPTEEAGPTPSEQFFFDNNGYLVLENFLAESHVSELQEALFRTIARRREKQEKDIPHTGKTDTKGEKSTRYPGKVPAGKRVGGFNQHKSLVPTILELAGIETIIPFDGSTLSKFNHIYIYI